MPPPYRPPEIFEDLLRSAVKVHRQQDGTVAWDQVAAHYNIERKGNFTPEALKAIFETLDSVPEKILPPSQPLKRKFSTTFTHAQEVAFVRAWLEKYYLPTDDLEPDCLALLKDLNNHHDTIGTNTKRFIEDVHHLCQESCPDILFISALEPEHNAENASAHQAAQDYFALELAKFEMAGSSSASNARVTSASFASALAGCEASEQADRQIVEPEETDEIINLFDFAAYQKRMESEEADNPSSLEQQLLEDFDSNNLGQSFLDKSGLGVKPTEDAIPFVESSVEKPASKPLSMDPLVEQSSTPEPSPSGIPQEIQLLLWTHGWLEKEERKGYINYKRLGIELNKYVHFDGYHSSETKSDKYVNDIVRKVRGDAYVDFPEESAQNGPIPQSQELEFIKKWLRNISPGVPPNYVILHTELNEYIHSHRRYVTQRHKQRGTPETRSLMDILNLVKRARGFGNEVRIEEVDRLVIQPGMVTVDDEMTFVSNWLEAQTSRHLVVYSKLKYDLNAFHDRQGSLQSRTENDVREMAKIINKQLDAYESADDPEAVLYPESEEEILVDLSNGEQTISNEEEILMNFTEGDVADGDGPGTDDDDDNDDDELKEQIIGGLDKADKVQLTNEELKSEEPNGDQSIELRRFSRAEIWPPECNGSFDKQMNEEPTATIDPALLSLRPLPYHYTTERNPSANDQGVGRITKGVASTSSLRFGTMEPDQRDTSTSVLYEGDDKPPQVAPILKPISLTLDEAIALRRNQNSPQQLSPTKVLAKEAYDFATQPLDEVNGLRHLSGKPVIVSSKIWREQGRPSVRISPPPVGETNTPFITNQIPVNEHSWYTQHSYPHSNVSPQERVKNGAEMYTPYAPNTRQEGPFAMYQTHYQQPGFKKLNSNFEDAMHYCHLDYPTNNAAMNVQAPASPQPNPASSNIIEQHQYTVVYSQPGNPSPLGIGYSAVSPPDYPHQVTLDDADLKMAPPDISKGLISKTSGTNLLSGGANGTMEVDDVAIEGAGPVVSHILIDLTEDSDKSDECTEYNYGRLMDLS